MLQESKKNIKSKVLISKNIAFLLLLVGALACDTKQNLKPRSQEVFIKYYGKSYNEEGKSVLLTSDGGFVMTGKSSSETEGTNTDVYVVKTDESGNIVFQKTFGGDGDDEGIKTIELPNGNYLVGANVDNGSDYDALFYELSSNGTLLKTFKLDPDNKPELHEFIEDFYYAEDSITMTGYTINDATSNQEDLLLARFSYTSDGNTDKSNLGYAKSGKDVGVKILPLSGGDVLLFHNEYQSGSGKNNVITSIWRAGESSDTPPTQGINFDSYNNSSNEGFASDMEFTFDGGFVCLLSNHLPSGGVNLLVKKFKITDLVLVGINEEWSTEVFYPEKAEAVSIFEQSDKNLVISATASSSSAQNEIAIMKLDQWGNQVFSSPIYFGGLLDDQAGEIIEDVNGNLLLTGTITFENKLKATLIKTNPSGRLEAN